MKNYATQLIAKPRPSDDVYKGDVPTQGIIDTVLYADPKAPAYTVAFAKTLKGASLEDTCRNIWEFVKTQIPYVLDERGFQWIKSPGRLWAEKAGDCKSFSVFTASCLRNLGIPYGYRFASYNTADPDPTHVYVYVPLKGGGEIILDSVWTGPFNTQKKFAHKKDFLMSKTYYLGEVGRSKRRRKPGTLKFDKPIDEITEGEMDLHLARQAAEVAKINAIRVGAIGMVAEYDQAIQGLNHALRNIDNPDVISGMGDELIGKAKKKKTNPDGSKKKTKVGKFLQKAGKAIKKGVKAITKVVTAPLRLVAKGAMEIYLPKAAMFFLYLFAPAGVPLPDMMARKQKKAQKFKDFVVKKIGMKDAHFMQIIRNNLAKRFGKSPESYLADKMKGRISGVGNPKKRLRATMLAKGAHKQIRRKKLLHPKAPLNFNTTFMAPVHDDRPLDTSDPIIAGWIGSIGGKKKAAKKAAKVPARKRVTKVNTAANDPFAVKPSVNMDQAQEHLDNLQADVEETAEARKGGIDVKKAAGFASKIATGNLLGAAFEALQWLISKLGFGEKLTKEDLPDIERDLSNAFEYQDLKEDYSNLDPVKKEEVKEVITEIIERKVPPEQIPQEIRQQAPYLNPAQVQEMTEEAEEGHEAVDAEEAAQLAAEIKKAGMNDKTPGRGFCDCGTSPKVAGIGSTKGKVALSAVSVKVLNHVNTSQYD